jgi:hypothetical protein
LRRIWDHLQGAPKVAYFSGRYEISLKSGIRIMIFIGFGNTEFIGSDNQELGGLPLMGSKSAICTLVALKDHINFY